MKLTAFVTLFFCFLSLYAQDTNKKVLYVPDVRGIVKTKFEYSFDDNLMRFAVRNARFGTKGNINESFSYYVQVDLSDEGKIKMLDAYTSYTPTKSLIFTIGQIKIPFSTDYIRNPAENFFANRSFVAKYINQGLRDIGATIKFKTKLYVPVSLWAGLFNGTGNNNPQWRQNLNYNTRIVIGEEKKGFSIKGNLYTGETETEKKLVIYGGEVCFVNDRLLIESEMIYREWYENIWHLESGFYLHSYYKFIIKNSRLKYILQTFRYDHMSSDLMIRFIDTQRYTFGTNFGFENKLFSAEIRLNYELYTKKSLPAHTDKFTIELVSVF